jgi:hypothetical protein
MKTFFGLLCLLAICITATSFRPVNQVAWTLADWVTCQIDKQVSVQVPVQPIETDIVKILTAQGASPEQLEKMKGTRLLGATDGVGNYMIVRTPIQANTLTKEPGSLTSFYDGMITSILRNERGTLLKRSPFTVNGAEGVDIDYRGFHKGEKKMVIKHSRVLAVENTAYILSLYPMDRNDSTGVALNEQRARFFNSIVYKPTIPAIK